jgi:fibronectin-binding autotransporter adhesin
VILTGANTFTGLTTITAGTLQIGSGGTTGSLIGNVKGATAAGNITNNGALVFDRSDALTYVAVMSGAGTLTQIGAGTWPLRPTPSRADHHLGQDLEIGGGTTSSLARHRRQQRPGVQSLRP